MPFQKNFSPRQLALFSSLVISFPVGLMTFFFQHKWINSLTIFIIFFIVIYRIILYIIRNYIQLQIKLIYKIISQTKATKREEFFYKNILPQKTIEEVRTDVEDWAEQRKIEIETLQQNEAFRKEFLQNLSHELKTPIFSIQGYVDTLLNGAIHNNEVNVKFLTNTARNVERLVNLVDDLDEISKLESGALELHYQNFCIQDLTKDVFEALHLKSSEKNISCSVKKECEAPINVNADKEKIRQVITNIVDNAIKYGKIDGTVETGFYKVEGDNVIIEITDNGIGISEEHRLRIFERFYRTDQARSRRIGGSGLGLAICKHIIEAHHHTIHVRSTPDVGTTFVFSLTTGK